MFFIYWKKNFPSTMNNLGNHRAFWEVWQTHSFSLLSFLISSPSLFQFCHRLSSVGYTLNINPTNYFHPTSPPAPANSIPDKHNNMSCLSQRMPSTQSWMRAFITLFNYQIAGCLCECHFLVNNFSLQAKHGVIKPKEMHTACTGDARPTHMTWSCTCLVQEVICKTSLY